MSNPRTAIQESAIGWLIALLVLIVAVGLMIFDLHEFTWPYALIAALAVARLT